MRFATDPDRHSCAHYAGKPDGIANRAGNECISGARGRTEPGPCAAASRDSTGRVALPGGTGDLA